MSEYPISYSIPFPGRKARVSKYPVTKLDVGGSFPTEYTNLNSARAAFSQYAKRFGIVLKAAEDPKRAGKIRVWRTA